MNVTKLSLVPLQQASLCLDCDMITAAHTHCFACGSVALMNLARTLNGEECNAAPPALAAAAVVSVRHTERPASISSIGSRRAPRLTGECIPFPQRSTNVDSKQMHRWYSLREVAAVVHRAMTVVLIGVIGLGAGR
jgi:hypothetical protein